jgi:L-ectoine synthase
VHETTVVAGTELRFNYQNHSESVYCIEGKATVEDVIGKKIYPIEPGTFYSVGIGDDHILRIERDTKFLCIFEPPLKGREEAD